MVATANIHDLPGILKSMFSHIMQLLLEQRLNRHTMPSSDKSAAISDNLYGYLKSIDINQHRQSATIDSEAQVTSSQPVNERSTVTASHVDRLVDEPHQLSEHLRERRGQSYTDSYLGKRLVRSAWAHISQAVSRSRQGDEANAKLHADIAIQAMKEARHYMSANEYEEFTASVLSTFKQEV